MTDGIYDIGLVCWVNINNIGNNLTNYALYQYLKDLNYSVLLITNPVNAPLHFSNNIDNRFGMFLGSPYLEDDVLPLTENKWQLSGTNHVCEKFILGSDQLWRGMFVKMMDFFTCLEWVESWKYMVAYGTSFGIGCFEGDENTKEKLGYLLRRFQKISVREPDGVKLLKKLYGIEAECVLDPVFLCDERYYEKMANNGRARLPYGRYIGAYLLDITEEKGKAVLTISVNRTNGVHAVMTQPSTVADVNAKLQVIVNPVVEEWLALVQNCEYFITDSFHGLCFALIFRKQFCVMFDKDNWRGLSRIQSLLGLLQLDSRLVENNEGEKILGICEEWIDYDKVDAILSMERERSRNWLKNSLYASKDYQNQYETHDFAWGIGKDLQKRMQELHTELEQIKEKIEREKEEIKKGIEMRDYKARNELYLLKHSLPKTTRGKKKKGKGLVQIVGWGAGGCFKRNIGKIKKFYDMKYVCDNDPKKWEKEMEESVICISPSKLLELENVLVVIMIDSAAVAFQVVKGLLEMGINNFEHVENWLSYIEGNAENDTKGYI